MKRFIEVRVFENDVDKAIRILRKKVTNAGVFAELRDRRHFVSKSEKEKRKKLKSIKRARKKAKKRNRSNYR